MERKNSSPADKGVKPTSDKPDGRTSRGDKPDDESVQVRRCFAEGSHAERRGRRGQRPQEPDPQKREKAAKKLGEMAQTAKDDQARKDAKDALKDAGAKADDGGKPKGSGRCGRPPMEPKQKPDDDKPGKGGEPAPMGDKTPMDTPKGR